jgi:hypothetical protein
MPGFWGVFEQFGVGLVFADEPNLAYREYLVGPEKTLTPGGDGRANFFL